MKQPKINIQGKIYKVLELGFHSKTGELDKVLFQIKEYNHCHIFKKNTMVNDKLTEDLPITETTRHPYHDYYHSPDLVSLLIFDDGKNDETFDIHSRIRLGQFIRTFLGLDLSIHDLKDVVDELPQEIVTRGFELDVQGSDVNGLLSNWVCENKELIKSKKTFDSEYLNSIREAVLQALNEYITDEQVREVAFHLPTDILKLVEEFGNNGVEVLDYIYRWSNEHIELIESFKTK